MWFELEGTRVRALQNVPLAGEGVPAARIVVTRRAQPVPRAEGRWLWLCEGTLPPAAAAEATLRGAYDAIALPAPRAQERLARRLRELADLAAEQPPPPDARLVAESAATRRILAAIAQAARTSQPVLLTGETGTGKEVAARLIHERSARAKGRFVPINCAAIPNELMEGELFGYAKGAFSGAVRAYDGLVAAGQGGTVFLDEIDDTPHALQVKLLRVLEDRVVSRLGENEWRRVDFRILAATNRDLRRLIEEGSFGADLYERLAVLHIHLPPLRERLEDLPALVGMLLERFYAEEPAANGRVRGVTQEALAALQAYPWPGNIRELRNVIFAALAAKRAGDELLASDLPRRVLRAEPPKLDVAQAIDAGAFNLRAAVEELERTALQAALARSGGNVAQAARLLGEVGRGEAADPASTVRAMMRRLGVPRRKALHDPPGERTTRR